MIDYDKLEAGLAIAPEDGHAGLDKGMIHEVAMTDNGRPYLTCRDGRHYLCADKLPAKNKPQLIGFREAA